MSVGHAVIGRALATSWIVLSSSIASVQAETWQVNQGRVAVACRLTLGGSFEARSDAVTGQVTVSEGARELPGRFVVDLRTLGTGIGLRDTHLRENYLEVSRGAGYETAVLDGIVLDAPAPARGRSASLGFRGVLTLHGRGNPVTGSADVSNKGDRLDVKVSFPVKIDVYEIARPSYLGVGVVNQVEVTVRSTLKLGGTPAS